MHYIVYDLEATCWEGKPPSKIQEVIEIGALKLDRYGEVLEVFNRLIKPVLNPNLSAFCYELTGITQEKIDRASSFAEVIEDFQDWAEIFDEEYVLCSWGNFDKKLLIQDCELHHLDSDWVYPHINLKRQYQEIKRLRRPRGLKSAVTKEGFEFTGDHHRGLDDAENLVKIFTKYLDEWRI